MIRLIVGLGNIGSEYANTRHNAGFMFVDQITNKYGGTLSDNNKFHGSLGKTRINCEEVILLKPSTLMNLSGLSVSAVMSYFKIEPKQILVVHDELDLPPGTIKLKEGGGLAGHNGLKSIASQIGTQSFLRLRIGIGHPRLKNLSQVVSDYVLSRPSSEDQELIEKSMGKAIELLPDIVDGKYNFVMSQLNEKAKNTD